MPKYFLQKKKIIPKKKEEKKLPTKESYIIFYLKNEVHY